MPSGWRVGGGVVATFIGHAVVVMLLSSACCSAFGDGDACFGQAHCLFEIDTPYEVVAPISCG